MDTRIEQVLETVRQVDRAVVEDDHAAFAAALSEDLVVNNPQNKISTPGVTKEMNVSGLISYARFERTVEYADVRGDFVLLMGEERVVPKGRHPLAGRDVRRRFTDLWKQNGEGRWVLTARHASVASVA
jgi:ketosteroid isomerase-like protein